MIEEIKAKNLIFRDDVTIECKTVDICPKCHKGIQPRFISGAYYQPNKFAELSVHYYCPLCKSCFITTYDVHSYTDNCGFKHYESYDAKISEPISFIGTQFPQRIVDLSPQFVEIYNQSENAEAIKLNQIAGMGYRKSLEFLVKDYSIHKNPQKQAEIEALPLAACIKHYIDNHKIHTLAEKSAWLGNDETHYVKKHTDRSTEDLKTFIKACANYIELELTLEDAETITKQN